MKVTAAEQAFVKRGILRTVSADEVLTRRAFRVLLALLAASFAGGIVFGFPMAATVATAIGFVGALAGARKPAVGLLGIGILCTLDPASRVFVFGKGVLPWNTFNYVLLFVMTLNFRSLLRLNDVSSTLLKFFVVMLVLWLAFAPLEALEYGFSEILNVATAFGLLVYFARGLGNKDTLYLVGLLCGITGALAGLLYNLQLDRLAVMNHNAWAYVPLTAMFGLALGLRAAPPTGTGQLWMAMLAVMNLMWVFLSASRGSLLVGTVCLIYILISMKSLSQRWGLLGGALLIAAIVLTRFSDMNVQSLSRLDKFLDPDESLAARTSGRSDLMMGAWTIFLENPMGVGTGGFPFAWKSLGYEQDRSGFAYGQRKAAHSAWLSTLAETGVFGILLFSAYVGSFAAVGWRNRHRGFLSLGVFTTVMLAFAFVSTEFMAKGLWFLAAGVTTLCNYTVAGGDLRMKKVRSQLSDSMAAASHLSAKTTQSPRSTTTTLS